MTLLTDWQGADPAGWLVQEKLDGWRVVWTGSEFVTRGGNVLEVPDEWLKGMPDFPLDGELFAGRGKFYQIQALIRDGFSGLKFMVFDAPSALVYQKRQRVLKGIKLPDHCELVPTVVCRDEAHWLAMADDIVKQGGEGIVGRPRNAKHVTGRDRDAQRWVPQEPDLNRLRK